MKKYIFLSYLLCSLSMTLCCENDKEFRLDIPGGKPKICDWIGREQKRKKRWCNKTIDRRKIDEACPKACGVCNTNDPNYKFVVNGKARKCGWIGTKLKVEKYCSRMDTRKIPISRYCRDSCNQSTKKPDPPNILIILADDVGVGNVKGYWDESPVDMPNIQKLVDQSTIFTNAHSTPLCAPSRYVLLSGNYQHRGRVVGGEWNLRDHQFEEKQKSIAEVLKTKANYHTAAFGKWHLGGKIEPNGFSGGKSEYILSDPEHNFAKPITKAARYLGFDESYISITGIQEPPYAFFRNDLLEIDSIKFWKKGSHKMPQGMSKILRSGEGSSTWDSSAYNMILVDEFKKFIGKHKKKHSEDPFFAYVALGNVHIPHSPPDTYTNGEKISGVYPQKHMDMLYEMDMNVGALIEELEDNGLMENTIVIFTSDNGGLPKPSAGVEGANSILRGYKGELHEGGHRVPFMIRYDGVIPGGKEEDSLIGINDIYATLCDIADVEIPSGSALDSISFADLVSPYHPKRERRQNIGIWRYKGNILYAGALLLSNGRKLIHYANGTVEYYNLENDLREKNDLSSEKWIKKRVKNMRSRLQYLRQS